MYAALLGTGIDAYLFRGLSSERFMEDMNGVRYADYGYPEWFVDDILLNHFWNPHPSSLHGIVVRFNGDPNHEAELLPNKTVILRTSDGEYAAIPYHVFVRNYYMVGQYRAALKENCVEYCYICGMEHEPFKLNQPISLRKMQRLYPVTDWDMENKVVIKNGRNVIRLMDIEQFDDTFESSMR